MDSYLDILEESLKKKLTVLDRIRLACDEQGELLKEAKPDMERFDELVAQKDEYITQLEKLDEGFQTMYDRIKEELLDNKQRYAQQIKALQAMITELTDKSVAIRAQEARNRDAVAAYFKREKQALGKSRISSKVAYGYYQSMDKAIAESASIMDMKK